MDTPDLDKPSRPEYHQMTDDWVKRRAQELSWLAGPTRLHPNTRDVLEAAILETARKFERRGEERMRERAAANLSAEAQRWRDLAYEFTQTAKVAAHSVSDVLNLQSAAIRSLPVGGDE